MNKVNFKKVVVAVFIMFLFTACSKKLMPPEISSSNDQIDSSDLTASNVTPPKDETLGDTGSTSDTGDSDFFAEEPILESFNKGGSSGNGGGASDGSGVGSDMTADNSFGSNPGPGGSGGSSMDELSSERQANIGNGSAGSFSATDKNANPFAGGGGNGSAGSFSATDKNTNPFAGSGGNSSSAGGNGLDVPDVPDDQIARMTNFQETSSLKDIHFSFDQYDLDSNSKEVLQHNASYLKQNPRTKIEIQGHCDERGTNNYNIALGERRAHSTKRFLVSQGINSSRINIISFGEEKPFCFNSNEDCWFQNRRAHFMIAK